MTTTYCAGAQSILTDGQWWGSTFQIGLALAIVAGLLLGRGLMRRVGGAIIFSVLWCAVYIPLMLIGSLWGYAAETYVDDQAEQAGVSSYSESAHAPN
jgi:polyferredoxin